MPRSRRGLTLAAASACALLAATAADAQTLADAVSQAYQTNPTLQSQRALLRASDENYVQARSVLRPQADLSADARYTRFGNDTAQFGIGTGDFDSSSVTTSLNLTQPLYTGGRATADIRATQADILSNREQLRGVEQQVILNVVQFFVDVRRDVEALRIRENNVGVLRRQLLETQARFEVGEITRTDVAQAEARLANAEALYASAQANLAISRANYTSVVGETPTDLAAEPPLPGLPATIDLAFAAAERDNPAIRAADFQEQAANARVASARSAYRPTVAFSASGSSSGSLTTSIFDNSNALTGQLRASIPLFTGGLNDSRVRQALEQENAARITVETRKREANQQVSSAWNSLLAARAQLISNQEQVRAATLAFQGVQEEQRVGLRTTLDVLNAEQELRNAELFLIQSRRDAYVAGASVLQAMGRLEAQDLVNGAPAFDPAANFEAVRRQGSVPWEAAIQRLDAVGAPRTTTPRPPEVPNPIPPETATVETVGTVWRADPNSIGPIPQPSNIPAAAPFRSSADPDAPIATGDTRTPGISSGRGTVTVPPDPQGGAADAEPVRSTTPDGRTVISNAPVPNPRR